MIKIKKLLHKNFMKMDFENQKINISTEFWPQNINLVKKKTGNLFTIMATKKFYQKWKFCKLTKKDRVIKCQRL